MNCGLKHELMCWKAILLEGEEILLMFYSNEKILMSIIIVLLQRVVSYSLQSSIEAPTHYTHLIRPDLSPEHKFHDKSKPMRSAGTKPAG